jgi:phosphatidate cytidylyltransferase
METTRLISAFFIVVFATLGIFLLSEKILNYLLLLISAISFLEFIKLRFSFNFSFLCTIIFSIFCLFVPADFLNLLLFISIILWIILSILVATFPHSKDFIQKNIFWIAAGAIIHIAFFYSSIFLISSTDLLTLSFGAEISGRLLFVYAISISALTDILAYFGGRRFGKSKFLPNISPNKTLEGFLISIVLCPLLLWALLFFALEKSAILFLFILFLTSLFSILGDATASLFKRVAGVKDSSKLIPGHGGLLDRLDSHLAAIPIFLILLKLTSLV